MAAGGYEIGLSGSASSGVKQTAQIGSGDVYVSTGGEKQSQTLFIVVGAVFAVVALMVLIFWRRR